MLVVFATLAAGGCGDDEAESQAGRALPPQQFPAALTSRVPPSAAELAKLRDVPSDVMPDSNDVSRVRLRNATVSKFFIGHWGGPPDNPGRFFCVYRIDPGQPGASANCFGAADYSAGVPTITTSLNRGRYELVGFTPDPHAQITVKLPAGSKRLSVAGNSFGLSSTEAPESMRITAFGKTSKIALN
jgi:hypothetical protein